MRVGTANSYDSSLLNLTTRQTNLIDQQEKMTAGKRVVRASDDPAAAAQAERALTRTVRVDIEQRALNVQRNSITMAMSTLSDTTDALQTLRELAVSAGDAAYSGANRTSIAQQMMGLRDQIFAYANKQDSNGIPLFGGLGGSAMPFTDASTGVAFNGLPGQRASTTISIPGAMDGQAVWMNVPTGNGVFKVELPKSPATPNAGTVWAEQGQVLDPAAITGDSYSINFKVDASVVPNVITYDVTNTTSATATNPIAAGRPYTSGQSIQFDGMSFSAQGTPANGDALVVKPSGITNLFKIIDDAIAGINGASSGNLVTQTITQALVEIDTGMARIQSASGQAGDLLNRADKIDSSQQGKSIQLAADRSRAEDIDVIKGISDFQNLQTGYDAALKTYAQVQKLSLFNYLG